MTNQDNGKDTQLLSYRELLMSFVSFYYHCHDMFIIIDNIFIYFRNLAFKAAELENK